MTAEVRVPRVAVDEIGSFDRRRHRKIDRHRLKRGRLWLRFGQCGPRLMACNARLVPRRSPGLDRDLSQASELAREVLNVSAGATVDLGRVFTGQERDVWTLHCRLGEPECERRQGRVFRPARAYVLSRST